MLINTASMLAIVLVASASVHAQDDQALNDPMADITKGIAAESAATAAAAAADSSRSAFNSGRDVVKSEFFATLGPTYTTQPFLLYKPDSDFATPGMNEWLLPRASDGPNGETTTFEYAILTDGIKDGKNEYGFSELGVSVTIGPTTMTFNTFVDYTEELESTQTWVPKTVSGTFTVECSYTTSPAIAPLPASAWSSLYAVSSYSEPLYASLRPENWPARHAVCTMDNEFVYLRQPGSSTVPPGRETFTMSTSIPNSRWGASTVDSWPIMTVLGEQKVKTTAAATDQATATQTGAAVEAAVWVNAVVVEVLVVAAAAVAL